MLIKDLTGMSSVINLKSKAKGLLQLNTQDFFAQLLSLQGNLSLPLSNPEYIEELNSILTVLNNNDYITVDFNNTYENGVLRTIAVLDDTLMTPRVKEQLLRQRKTLQQHIDLGVSAINQELFTEQPDIDTIIAIKFLAKKRQAIMRGIEFKLTLQDFTRLVKTKRCYYTGATLTLEGNTALTLDRIDATKGYLRENTCACSSIVNYFKSKLVEDVKVDALSQKELKKMLMKFAEVV